MNIQDRRSDGEARVSTSGRHFNSLWGKYVAVLAVGTATFLQSGTSHAFKLQSHEAVALNAAAEIEKSFGPGGSNKLVFNVNGQRLEVPISAIEVFNAVRNQQTYFLAGALGPDTFPDPITGQWIAHENETANLMSWSSTVSGRTINDLKIWEPFEKRHSVTQYRAIDFAVDMLKFYQSDYKNRCSTCSDEHDQIVAFIAGYISHGVTDAFAHTWVNDLVGASWSFDKGSGIFGTFTEEVQHIAVETLVDYRAPKTVFETAGDAGGYGRIAIQAPTAFLDAFYSSATALGNDIHYNISNDPIQFVDYYRNLDLFRGGVVYLYFNAQIDVLPALRSWSRMGWLFDLAESVKNNTLVNVLLDLAEIPDRVVHELTQYAPQGIDTVTKLATFGYAHCVPMNTVNVYGNQPYTDSVRDALNFLGGMNERIAAHAERARVARVNYPRLSACIGENFAKANAAPFDPSRPTENTDACADIVRAGYQDEGNPDGLYRGNVRGNSALDREFLMDLKGSFLGGNPDDIYANIPDNWKGDAPYHADLAYEQSNLHRSALSNFKRVITYLQFPGSTIAGVKEAILPSKDGPGTLDKFHAICADARDTGFQHCLDLVTLPIAATARQLSCEYDFGVCAANATGKCLKKACDVGCHSGIGFSCDSLCGHATGCQGWCDDNLCATEFGITVCVPGVYQACSGVCELIGGSDSSCVQDAAIVAECGYKDVVCSWDNIVATAELQGLGNGILSPVRKVCDVVDAAEAFFECLKGDPSLPVAQQKANRHTCVVDACNEVISLAGSNLPSQLSGFNCEATYTQIEHAYDEVQALADTARDLWDAAQKHPEQFVNVVFFQKDMAKDGAYRSAIVQTIGDKRSSLASNPPPASASPDEIQLWQDELTVLDNLNNVANGGGPSTSLDAIRFSRALNALMQQPWPELFGPTTRQILSDMGPDFENTFTPAFNAVQATKLTPMMNAMDVENLFTQQVVAKDLLPWRTPATGTEYSQICRNPANLTSLYCDVITSFDDPNCKGPECNDPTYSVADASRHNWVPGRGLVAFNPYDATKPVQNVLTSFPFSSTQEAYDKIYTHIFRVPRVLPGFFGFDDPNNPWTSPTAKVTPDTTRSTEGTGSTDVLGCNFNDILSPRFRTADLGVVGTTLLIDVYLPSAPNPNWAGDMQISATIPGANIYNSYLNNGNPIPYKGLHAGWNTLTFPIPTNIQTALLGDYAAAQFVIHTNIVDCTHALSFDNLRFGGTLTQRLNFHIRPSQTYSVATGRLMGFDNVNDWTANTSESAAPTFIEGTGALSVPGGAYNPIMSRKFTLAESGIPSSSMSIDVFIPGKQTNRNWFGDVQLFWNCDHFSQVSLGTKPLTNGFEDEYNSLRFEVPSGLLAFLKGAPSTERCQVTVGLNTSPGGNFYLDNLGFIH